MAHSFQVSGVEGIIELTYAGAEKVSAELHSSNNLNDKNQGREIQLRVSSSSTSEERRNHCAPQYSEMYKTANKLFRIPTMPSVNKH
jgi:hypothetical protein